MSEDLKLRQRILTRWGTLKKEREPYMTQWLEISEHITPSRGRFLIGKNRNESRSGWNRIVDSSAVRAANILAAGLMSGMTDPSSQWFALTTGTPNLDEAQAVKVWLDQVQRIMEMAFTRTNTYQALHQGWRDVGTYGVMLWSSQRMTERSSTATRSPWASTPLAWMTEACLTHSTGASS